jgi:hypothetical protein
LKAKITIAGLQHLLQALNTEPTTLRFKIIIHPALKLRVIIKLVFHFVWDFVKAAQERHLLTTG